MNYFTEFMRRAKRESGGVGYAYRLLQKHFPLDEFTEPGRGREKMKSQNRILRMISLLLLMAAVAKADPQKWEYAMLTVVIGDSKSVASFNDGKKTVVVEINSPRNLTAEPAPKREAGKLPTLVDLLNDLGSAGWQMIAGTSGEEKSTQYILKRSAG